MGEVIIFLNMLNNQDYLHYLDSEDLKDLLLLLLFYIFVVYLYFLNILMKVKNENIWEVILMFGGYLINVFIGSNRPWYKIDKTSL